MKTNTIGKKNWGHSDKLFARKESVIGAYKLFFGKDKLVSNKQYWTLCGRCADENGLISGCEFDQLTTLGFIKPDQFHGVEHNQNIAKHNIKLKEGHWYHEEFISCFANNCNNPGIINFDHHKSPKTISSKDNYIELYKLLRVLERRKTKNCLLIVNSTIKCGGSLNMKPIDALCSMVDCFMIKMPIMNENGNVYGYLYNGTQSKTGTRMMTIYFRY